MFNMTLALKPNMKLAAYFYAQSVKECEIRTKTEILKPNSSLTRDDTLLDLLEIYNNQTSQVSQQLHQSLRQKSKSLYLGLTL